MKLIDRIFGRNTTLDTAQPSTEDEQAIERYQYLIRNADPHIIEQAHLDAFEKLTPRQLDLMFERFTATPPAGEKPSDPTPAALAATATRAEAQQPGVLARTLSDDQPREASGRPRNSFFGTFAAYAIASTAIDAIFWTGLIAATAVAPTDTSGAESVQSADGADAEFLGGFDF